MLHTEARRVFGIVKLIAFGAATIAVCQPIKYLPRETPSIWLILLVVGWGLFFALGGLGEALYEVFESSELQK